MFDNAQGVWFHAPCLLHLLKSCRWRAGCSLIRLSCASVQRLHAGHGSFICQGARSIIGLCVARCRPDKVVTLVLSGWLFAQGGRPDLCKCSADLICCHLLLVLELHEAITPMTCDIHLQMPAVSRHMPCDQAIRTSWDQWHPPTSEKHGRPHQNVGLIVGKQAL